MEGSAAVIGTMLAPILESCDPPAAREHARQLGLAFQLTNFIRNLGEDFQRGRVYLPAEDLARFGVGRAGYQVLDRRVAVPRHRRLQVAGRHWAAARAAARAERRVTITTPGTP
jgi:15-cis-phytoene synthase